MLLVVEEPGVQKMRRERRAALSYGLAAQALRNGRVFGDVSCISAADEYPFHNSPHSVS
jgi:hypothetical protein